MTNKVDFNILLFNDYEILDAHGPAEVVSKLDEYYRLVYLSMSGGVVRSAQGSRIETIALREVDPSGILLIPGGIGTRVEVSNAELISSIGGISESAAYVLTVCTGSALLARTGLLRNRRATTNKLAFDWVADQDRHVDWIRKARWVVDGKYYTSSGVSAGMDMTLAFIADRHDMSTAERVARRIEYVWNSDEKVDPFVDNATVLGRTS
jgi:transcriptional regulator GlxA family with amidase domain